MIATAHFKERVGETDPDKLAWWLGQAIEQARDDLVQYVCRVDKNGLRAFKFKVKDGRIFYAILNTSQGKAITILPPGYDLGHCGSRYKIPLRDY